MMLRTRSLSWITALSLGFAACGGGDAGVAPDAADPLDAGVDAPADAATDAPVDAPIDAPVPIDGSPDAPSDPPQPPIERAQAGGTTAAIAIAGHRAFVGVGPRVTVWELGLGVPARVGESAPLSGVINGLAVVGDTVFAVSATYGDGAFHVLDAADPATPVERSRLRLGTGTFSNPAAIDVEGTAAYVSDTEQGLFRIDVSAPAAPAVTAFRPMSSLSILEASGDRVYAAGAGLFGVWVATFDANLAPLGTTHVQNAMAAAITADGLLLTRTPTSFAVDDLATPSAPRRLHSAALAVWAMVPAAGGAWLTVDGRLRYLDLADRSAIALGPPNDEPVWAVLAADATGDRIAFASYQGELTAFATPAAGPQLLGRVATGPCAHCYATASEGERLVIAESTPGAVGTIGTAELADLALDGQHLQLSTDFEDIAVAGGHAYVADWFTGLRVFDVSDPTRPTPAATVATGTYPSAIAVAGARVYAGESTNGGALRVFSPHGAGAPVQLGAIATGQIADLAADGALVFTAEGAVAGVAGMRIYDTQDPTAIATLATFPCSQATGVAVHGGLALVSCPGAVHVVDVSDPAAPVALAVWTPPGVAEAGLVALDGTRGYFGHRHGVTVIDLATPSAPATLAELPTAWMVRDLTVAGPGRIVAATSQGGLYQWQL